MASAAGNWLGGARVLRALLRCRAQVSVNINIPAAVLASVEAALRPLFEDIAHNKELGSWFSVRLVGTADPLKLELGIAWECNHKGARAT